MALTSLLLTFAASALVIHLARYWRPLAFAASLAVTGILIWAVRNTQPAPFEIAGISFALEPLAQDYLIVAVLLSGVLAAATSLGAARRAMGFMFWSWILWLVALVVNNFVVGVFAWVTGLAAMVIAMEPRPNQRVGGAAYFLVLVIVAAALLLVGHRFVELYPVTPDQVTLLESALLFLAWGFGLLLAIGPFMLWLGPMGDETPPAIIAVLLGVGQPLGFVLFYSLAGEYPRLIEQSEFSVLMTRGGMAAVLVGGLLCAVERRAGRLMSFAALYSMGFILLDQSRGTLEGLVYSVVEILTRAIGLGMMAASLTIGRNIEQRWSKHIAVVVFVFGGLLLAGLSVSSALMTRWNLMLELQITNPRVFYALLLATFGVLLGVLRYAGEWLYTPAPAQLPLLDSASLLPSPSRWDPRPSLRDGLRRGWAKFVQRLPHRLRTTVMLTTENWRAAVGVGLLSALALFFVWFNFAPDLWFQRALETISQLPIFQ